MTTATLPPSPHALHDNLHDKFFPIVALRCRFSIGSTARSRLIPKALCIRRKSCHGPTAQPHCSLAQRARASGKDRLRAESPKQGFWKAACRGPSALIRYGRETYGDAIGYSVAAPLALTHTRDQDLRGSEPDDEKTLIMGGAWRTRWRLRRRRCYAAFVAGQLFSRTAPAPSTAADCRCGPRSAPSFRAR